MASAQRWKANMKTRLPFKIGLCAVVLCGCATNKDFALQPRPPGDWQKDHGDGHTGISLFRLADGKIQEITVSMDRLGQAQQLGWLPAPAPPAK